MDVFQLYRFTSDLGRLLTWMEMTEDKLASVSETSGEDKGQMEACLRETQAIQNEINRKKPELTALLNTIQVCIYNFLLLVILKERFFAHCSRHGTYLLRKNSCR